MNRPFVQALIVCFVLPVSTTACSQEPTRAGLFGVEIGMKESNVVVQLQSRYPEAEYLDQIPSVLDLTTGIAISKRDIGKLWQSGEFTDGIIFSGTSGRGNYAAPTVGFFKVIGEAEAHLLLASFSRFSTRPVGNRKVLRLAFLHYASSWDFEPTELYSERLGVKLIQRKRVQIDTPLGPNGQAIYNISPYENKAPGYTIHVLAPESVARELEQEWRKREKDKKEGPDPKPASPPDL